MSIFIPNTSYYAGIMFDAFRCLYAQNYAGIIGRYLIVKEIEFLCLGMHVHVSIGFLYYWTVDFCYNLARMLCS